MIEFKSHTFVQVNTYKNLSEQNVIIPGMVYVKCSVCDFPAFIREDGVVVEFYFSKSMHSFHIKEIELTCDEVFVKGILE